LKHKESIAELKQLIEGLTMAQLTLLFTPTDFGLFQQRTDKSTRRKIASRKTIAPLPKETIAFKHPKTLALRTFQIMPQVKTSKPLTPLRRFAICTEIFQEFGWESHKLDQFEAWTSPRCFVRLVAISTANDQTTIDIP
jgi:hypothetical protein